MMRAHSPYADLDLALRLSGRELVERWIEAGVVAGFVGRLSVRAVSADDGKACFACATDADHANFAGLVHGGVSAALVDVAGAAAALTLLQPGETLLTTDLGVRYIAPAPIDTHGLIAEGEVNYRDDRRIVSDVRISSGGQIVALGTVAVSIRRPISQA